MELGQKMLKRNEAVYTKDKEEVVEKGGMGFFCWFLYFLVG